MGTDFAGGDRVFGNNLGVEELKPVFDDKDGQRAEPVGFRRGIWHESFGNGAFDIYEELQAGGCVYLDQVHTADCWRFGRTR